MLQKIFSNILSFALPNACISCQANIGAQEKYLCKACLGKLETYNRSHPWKDEKVADGTMDNSLSAYWFREGAPIQPLLHAMKYRKMKGVGLFLGNELGKLILRHPGTHFDFIVPVPLHKAKFRDRTYNQSEFIAQGISAVLNAEVIKDLLIRTRFTGTQTRLTKPERKENVSGAFEVNPKYADIVRSKNIILVDDVITTGATILECASSLKKASAGSVWVCSAAYAELKLNVV